MPAIGQLSAVAHPHLEHAVALVAAEILDAAEQPGVAARPHLGVAEFAVVPALDLATELLRHRLHAVADAEHRHAEREDLSRCAVGRLLVGRHVASGKDHALRREVTDELPADLAGMDLAVHA